MSCSVAKLALPITRLSIMRPATAACMVAGFQFLVRLAAAGRVQIAGEMRALEVVGEGVAAAAQAVSLARRSAMIWLSSARLIVVRCLDLRRGASAEKR